MNRWTISPPTGLENIGKLILVSEDLGEPSQVVEKSTQPILQMKDTNLPEEEEDSDDVVPSNGKHSKSNDTIFKTRLNPSSSQYSRVSPRPRKNYYSPNSRICHIV